MAPNTVTFIAPVVRAFRLQGHSVDCPAARDGPRFRVNAGARRAATTTTGTISFRAAARKWLGNRLAVSVLAKREH